MAKILLVEDEQVLRKNIARFFRRKGHEVACAGDSGEAVVLLSREPFDILVTDLLLPSGEAFELVAEATTKAVTVVVMTAYGSPQLQEMLYEEGIFAYLEKPIRLETLLSFVEKALIECAS